MGWSIREYGYKLAGKNVRECGLKLVGLKCLGICTYVSWVEMLGNTD